MLYFKSQQDGRVLFKLSDHEHGQLVKMGLLRPGTTGSLADDGAEILPLFDDFELTVEHQRSMYAFAEAKRQELLKIPGFQSALMTRFLDLLKREEHLDVTCD